MVKNVAQMAVKYDLKAFVEHKDNEEKKDTYPIAKKILNRGSLRFWLRQFQLFYVKKVVSCFLICVSRS